MTQDFYNKVANKFGNYTTPAKYISVFPDGEPEKVFKQKLLELSSKDKIVLDAGCGDGRFTLSIADRFNKVIGNDRSKLMLSAAKKLQEKLGNKNVEFIEKSTRELNFPINFFDIIYVRRSPTYYPLFYKLLKSGGYILSIGVGEKDTKDIKKIFGRGQNYGQWNKSRLDKEKRDIEKSGLKVIYSADFFYNEYFPTKKDLDFFLQGVPIFEDYDSKKDEDLLNKYIDRFRQEKGILFSRHRYVIIATKP